MTAVDGRGLAGRALTHRWGGHSLRIGSRWYGELSKSAADRLVDPGSSIRRRRSGRRVQQVRNHAVTDGSHVVAGSPAVCFRRFRSLPAHSLASIRSMPHRGRSSARTRVTDSAPKPSTTPTSGGWYLEVRRPSISVSTYTLPFAACAESRYANCLPASV